jgi:hypothetical protein
LPFRCGRSAATAKELLARAVHLADLYNWVDAAPAFAEAEHLFVDAGDRRNALYAKLGLIRSNIDREPQTLPAVAAQLAEELEDDPMLQNDKERLKLMAARSTDEVRSLRDQIFLKEQARWITPGASVLKNKPREALAMEQIQQALAPLPRSWST